MADTWVQQNDANSSTSGAGAVTLAEAAKLEKDVLKAGVMELFVENNPILGRIPWEDISGNSLMYDYEVALPGVGFRSVNEGYTQTHSRFGQRTVGLAIFGGELDVDKFIVKTRSSTNDQRSQQERGQVKSMSLSWLKYFFDGHRDNGGANEEFDGVNILLADAYHTAAGAAKVNMTAPSTGDGWKADELLLDYMDEALDLVIGPNSSKVILCNKTTRRWMSRLARANAQIDIGVDAWGYQVTKYNGVPLVEIETDAEGTEILGFDETMGNTTTATASIYVARFEPGYVQGVQNGGMMVEDLGILETKPAYRTRVEWYCALALMHPRSIARVPGLYLYT